MKLYIIITTLMTLPIRFDEQMLLFNKALFINSLLAY